MTQHTEGADPAHCPATMFDGHKQVGCLLAFGHTGDHLTDEGAWWTEGAAPVAGETAQQQRMTAAGASLRLNELLREPEALRAALAGSPNNERARLLGVLEAPGFVLMAAADALEFKGDRLRDEGRVDEAEAAFRAQDALLAWRRGADLCCGLCDGPFPCADTEHGNRYPYTAPAVETARRAAAAPPAPEPPTRGDPQPAEQQECSTCGGSQPSCPVCHPDDSYERHEVAAGRGTAERAPEGGEPLRREHFGRDWLEDEAHENGRYQNTCIHCHLPFIGHKRRVVCHQCADVGLAPPAPSAQDAEDEAWLEEESHGSYEHDPRSEQSRCRRILARLRAARGAGRCICGEPLVQCTDCAVADWQAAHPDCQVCCPQERGGAGQAPAEPGAACEPGRKHSRPWCCTHDAPLVCLRAPAPSPVDPHDEESARCTCEWMSPDFGEITARWPAVLDPDCCVHMRDGAEDEVWPEGVPTEDGPAAPAPVEGALREALAREDHLTAAICGIDALVSQMAAEPLRTEVLAITRAVVPLTPSAEASDAG